MAPPEGSSPGADADVLSPAGHEPELADLAAFLLGALPEREEARVRGHLILCERCRAARPELERLLGLLREVPASVLQDGPPQQAEELIRRAVQAILARDGGGGDPEGHPGDGPGAGGDTSPWATLPWAVGRPAPDREPEA